MLLALFVVRTVNLSERAVAMDGVKATVDSGCSFRMDLITLKHKKHEK